MTRLLLMVVAFLFSTTVYAQTVDMAFSPDAQAKELILKTIESSNESIRMSAYSFTSPEIVQKLIEAKQRGVDIRIIVDEKGNRSASSKRAMNMIVSEDIPLRTTSQYKIHHDKFMVIDGRHVETGSFNYTESAANRNSENVILIKDHEGVAQRFSQHWESRWNNGKPWKPE